MSDLGEDFGGRVRNALAARDRATVLGVPLAIASGGTGQITAPAALAALGGVAAAAHSLLKGSGSGNYTTASTSYVAVDATNLSGSAIVPVGSIALILATGSLGTLTASNTAQAQLQLDGAAAQTANCAGTALLAPGAPFAVLGVIVGDGASHTWELFFKATSASDSATMLNSSADAAPRILVVILSGS